MSVDEDREMEILPSEVGGSKASFNYCPRAWRFKLSDDICKKMYRRLKKRTLEELDESTDVETTEENYNDLFSKQLVLEKDVSLVAGSKYARTLVVDVLKMHNQTVGTDEYKGENGDWAKFIFKFDSEIDRMMGLDIKKRTEID